MTSDTTPLRAQAALRERADIWRTYPCYRDIVPMLDNAAYTIEALTARVAELEGDRTHFVLPREDFERFVEACENTPPANEKLKELFRKYGPYLQAAAQGDGA